MEGDNQVTVAGTDQPFAFYTRYPDMGKSLWPAEAYDLECPKCSSQEIVLIQEAEKPAQHMVGDLAQCWICKLEFRITENCWRWRKVKG